MCERSHLQEAQNIGSLGGVAGNGGGLTESGGECRTLAKGTVLDSGGEERAGVDFLPEIESMRVF